MVQTALGNGGSGGRGAARSPELNTASAGLSWSWGGDGKAGGGRDDGEGVCTVGGREGREGTEG